MLILYIWSAMLSGPCTPFRTQPVRLVTWRGHYGCSHQPARVLIQHVCRLGARWTATRITLRFVTSVKKSMALLGVTAPAGCPIIWKRTRGLAIVAVVLYRRLLQLDGATTRQHPREATTDIGSALHVHASHSTLHRSTRSMGIDRNSLKADMAHQSQQTRYRQVSL